MRLRSLSPARWPAWVWLAGLSLVLFIRFPMNFTFLSRPFLMDFEVYRSVSLRLMQGDARHLYDPTTSPVMMFKYAPLCAFAWIPLAWIPSSQGSVLWMSLTVLWLALACHGAGQLCQRAGLRAPPWLPILTVFLLSRSIWGEFLNGQVDILWGLLVIAFLLADVADQPWRAALWLSLAISLKLPALIFVPYLIIRGRLTLAAQTLGLFLATNVAACILLLPSSPVVLIRDWASALWASGPDRAFEIGSQSLLALVGRFCSNDGYRLNVLPLSRAGVVLVMAAVSAALFSLVVMPGRRSRDSSGPIFDGALLTVLMVLCSPTVWTATYSALILPVTLAVACALTNPAQAWRQISPALCAAAVIILSLMTHSALWHALGIRSFRHESYVFLVLMVLPWLGLALFAYLWQQRRRLARNDARDGAPCPDISGSSAIDRLRPARQ